MYNIPYICFLFFFFLWGNREFEIKNTITVEPVLGGIILSVTLQKGRNFHQINKDMTEQQNSEDQFC